MGTQYLDLVMMPMFGLILTGLVWTVAAQEILQNPGFEDSDLSPWICSGGCSLEASTDSQAGVKAAKVTGR